MINKPSLNITPNNHITLSRIPGMFQQGCLINVHQNRRLYQKSKKNVIPSLTGNLHGAF